MRSTLQHTPSPPQSNEATSHEDELSKIYGRHQKVTRLPHSDIKPENVIVGTPPKIREIPAKMMSIEEATAIQNEHHHPPPLPLHHPFLITARIARSMNNQLAHKEGSSGVSDEDKTSIEAAKNILVEGIIAYEASINVLVEEIIIEEEVASIEDTRNKKI